ncbi:MAG: hypothetical protein AAFR35_04545 [Pseudomonadota bacterium]
MAEREIEELLVFYVGGTLDPIETARMEAAIAADPALELQVATLRALREASEETAQSPGEFGLARLMRDVETDSAPRAAMPRTRIWQAVAGIAVAAFLAQAVLVTQSSDEVTLAGEDVSGDLIVAFAPDATEGAIRDLLVSEGLIIVDGPSALGLYVLELPDGADPTAATDALVASGLVESVEDAP